MTNLRQTLYISDLVLLGSVVECVEPPFVVNPLLVSIQSNSKNRLILDLRHVNFFVRRAKIKFEDAKSMLTVLLKSNFFWRFSLDIKSEYHIKMFEPDQCFLGFSWKFSGATSYKLTNNSFLTITT